MSEMMAFYKPGKYYLQTLVTDGRVQYTNLTVEEYKAKHPDYLYLPATEAIEMVRKELDKLQTPWLEIDFDTWDSALMCMPPEKWIRVDKVEIFRLSEYMCSDITSHYAKIWVKNKYRYFTALRKTSISYEDLAKEVRDYVDSLQDNESVGQSNPLPG